MKTILRWAALLLTLATLAFWAVAGANRGWTKTRVPKTFLDEVTGLEGITYEKRFVPGLDFLGVLAVAAGGLAAASLFFRNRSQNT
jgi:hypothetical protein